MQVLLGAASQRCMPDHHDACKARTHRSDVPAHADARIQVVVLAALQVCGRMCA